MKGSRRKPVLEVGQDLVGRGRERKRKSFREEEVTVP